MSIRHESPGRRLPVDRPGDGGLEPVEGGRAGGPDPFVAARNRMVQRHLVERGIKDKRVLEAFRTVPRHRFLPPETRRQAYDDESIPIGEGQTITAPFDVAFMTEVLDPKPTDRVYEVGTGSGYQAAILSRLVKEVYSVEIHEPLGKRATQVLKELGYTNVKTRVGDGYAGWPEAAPFDAIIVTCAPRAVPPPLVEQLKEGGRLVIPLGDRFHQTVHLMIKRDGKLIDRELRPTLFVPMTGRAQKEAPRRQGEGRVSMSRLRTLALAIGLLVLLRSGVVGQESEAEIERPGPPAARGFRGRREPGRRARRLVQPARSRGSRRGRGGRSPISPVPERPGRGGRARSSRAFGVDGRKTEAIIIGLWVRVDGHPGRRAAGRGPVPRSSTSSARASARSAGGCIGPWTSRSGTGWVRVARRIPVPPDARDAILTVGLLGATGTLDDRRDDVRPRPGRGAWRPTNLVLNGDFELGDSRAVRLARRAGRPPRLPGLPIGFGPGADQGRARGRRAGSPCRSSRSRSWSVTVAVRARGLRGSGGPRPT